MLHKFKKLNPPVRWLLGFIAVLIGFAFLFPPKPYPVKLAEISYGYSSSSKLYFHNMRSYFYHINENERPPLVLYRLKKRQVNSSSPLIQFMIVENKRTSEAYLYAELNLAAKRLTEPAILFTDVAISERARHALKKLKNDEHYKLGAKVYQHLVENEQIYLLSGTDTITSLFRSKNSKMNTLTTLEDYFNLINKN